MYVSTGADMSLKLIMLPTFSYYSVDQMTMMSFDYSINSEMWKSLTYQKKKKKKEEKREHRCNYFTIIKLAYVAKLSFIHVLLSRI